MTAFRGFSAAALILLAACTSPSRSAGPASDPGKGGEDAVRLTSGETVRGRILEETPRQVILERETVVSAYPRAAIFGIDYARDRWLERRQTALPAAEPPPAAARP